MTNNRQRTRRRQNARMDILRGVPIMQELIDNKQVVDGQHSWIDVAKLLKAKTGITYFEKSVRDLADACKITLTRINTRTIENNGPASLTPTQVHRAVFRCTRELRKAMLMQHQLLYTYLLPLIETEEGQLDLMTKLEQAGIDLRSLDLRDPTFRRTTETPQAEPEDRPLLNDE